ncbi:MAG: DNA-directed RNA polymerase subunit alpha C-terminal domain-containing protein [Pirellulales bacterium]
MGIMIRRRTWADIAPNSPRKLETLLEEGVAVLGLGVRTTNALESCGIITLQQLLQRTPSQLLGIKNFGVKTLREVFKSLVALGFPEPKGYKMKTAGVRKVRRDEEAVEISVAAARPTREEMVEERLSAASALRRCIDDLEKLLQASQFAAEGAVMDAEQFAEIAAAFAGSLEWIVSYAKSRLPYSPEDVAAMARAKAEVEEQGEMREAAEEPDLLNGAGRTTAIGAEATRGAEPVMVDDDEDSDYDEEDEEIEDLMVDEMDDVLDEEPAEDLEEEDVPDDEDYEGGYN